MNEDQGKLTTEHDETAVKERTRVFQAAVAASPVPIVVIDADTSVRLWNPAADRLFGCSKEEVISGLLPIVPFEQRGEPCEAVAEVDSLVGGELDSKQLLQTVTDACTLIAGAQFGAASYNVADDGGGHYLLYCRSGTPREVLGPLAMPHKTIGFAPPSVADTQPLTPFGRPGYVARDRWYDMNTPHQGSSPEHLPLGSYLAVPMIGHSGEVCGGLFLGHPDADVFTKDAKRVVVALAAYAAISIDNARLCEAERRARNAAEAASRAKDEFLAVLGHELRNPLSTVRNGIVAARLDPARRDRALELASRGAEQLSRLIDDLLDVARIAHGKTTLRREPMPLAQIVERAIESGRQLCEERGHVIAVPLLDSDVWVDGDALRLEQVIGNLLSNAAKYMDPGGQITVAVAHEDGEAVVRVRDSGMGIAPEVLPRVFDLFAQAEQSLDRAQGGLGIGLALVKRLVELHGGRVEAHSDGCGRGAEFIVRLPALGPADEAATPRPLANPGGDPCACVLVVEDDANGAEMTAMLLERLGHRVRAVGDGPSALQAALENPPDVMLVDIGLPGMDGYEVAQEVRQRDSLQHVNLVALTGYGRDEDRQRALAAGFDYHLAKPVNVDELRGLVAQLATPKQLSLLPV